MSRYLVVAHETVTNPELLKQIKAVMSDEEMTTRPGYAGVVVSTLPKEASRWLRTNLPDTVRSKYGLPVYHVQAPPDWSAGDLP